MKSQTIVAVRIHHIFILFSVPPLDIADGLPQTFSSLYENGIAGLGEAVPLVHVRDFSKGTASFLTVTVGKVPDSAPFVWLVLVERLRRRFKPSPCRFGESRNFSERAASFLISTVGDERVW